MNIFKTGFNKPTTVKIFSLAALAVACICAAATFVMENANFSGEWTLNEQKSDLGQNGGRMAARKLKVQQTAEGMSLDRTSSFNGEDRTMTDKITFDGKESESTVFGTSKKKTSAKWSDDGQTLNVNSVINFERDGQTTEIKVTEAWKLVNNGQSLSIESVTTSPRGTNTMKAIYDKGK
jgi:hypothetical protein